MESSLKNLKILNFINSKILFEKILKIIFDLVKNLRKNLEND